MEASVDDARVVTHDGGADVLPTGTGWTFTTTTASPPPISCHPFSAQSPAPRPPKAGSKSTTDRFVSLQARWGVQPAATSLCPLFLDPAHRAESCLLTSDGQERQKVPAAREVGFQNSGVVSARCRSGLQYGRQRSPKLNNIPRSSTQKPKEYPAAQVNVLTRLAVVIEDVRPEILDSLPKSGKTEGDG